jgi:hypothetical protein
MIVLGHEAHTNAPHRRFITHSSKLKIDGDGPLQFPYKERRVRPTCLIRKLQSARDVRVVSPARGATSTKCIKFKLHNNEGGEIKHSPTWSQYLINY